MNVLIPVACVMTIRRLHSHVSTTNQPIFSSMTNGVTKVANGYRPKLMFVVNCVKWVKKDISIVLVCVVVVVYTKKSHLMIRVKTMFTPNCTSMMKWVIKRVHGWRNNPRRIKRVGVNLPTRQQPLVFSILLVAPRVEHVKWLVFRNNRAFPDNDERKGIKKFDPVCICVSIIITL